MQKINLFVLLSGLLTLMLTGCSKPNGKRTEEPVLSIELATNLLYIGTMPPADTVRIIGGNGGYRIIFPKQIEVNPIGSGTPEFVDYSEDILTLQIVDENKIVSYRR